MRLLALTAAHPDRAFEAGTIGAHRGRPAANGHRRPHRPLDAAEAREQLASAGRPATTAGCASRCRLLRTSAASARPPRGRGPGAGRARAWESDWNFDKEDHEPEHVLVLGGVLRSTTLLAEPPRRRRGLGRRDAERLGRYARRLWDGLLAGEQVTTRERRRFDVCGPLPSGVTVLEASAGTGKTYTIAALAARYVAEGNALKELLLVTFTRMATGELRERVRERLVAVEEGLELGGAGVAPRR